MLPPSDALAGNDDPKIEMVVRTEINRVSSFDLAISLPAGQCPLV